MPELNGVPGELRFTLEIRRADTGKVEKVEMVGRLMPEDKPDDLKESQDGCNALDRR